MFLSMGLDGRFKSLSARRAWIEMKSRRNKNPMLKVALRKESVDRNLIGCVDRAIDIMSLSARRAWIEILHYRLYYRCVQSLSARRAWIEIAD